MRNSWPDKDDTSSDPDATKRGFASKCTCTPLADDPDCVVHASVPSGEEPLSLKDISKNATTPSQKFLVNATIVSVSLCIIAVCAALLFFIIGVAVRAFLWMTGAI